MLGHYVKSQFGPDTMSDHIKVPPLFMVLHDTDMDR